MKVPGLNISNNSITSMLRQQNSNKEGLTLKRLAQYGKAGLETGVNVGGSVGLTFVGFLALLAGAIGKTIAPDKSSFDLLSLFGIIAGGIMSAFGLYKVATVGSKAVPKSTGSGYVVEGVEDVINSIKRFDKNAQKPYDKGTRSKLFMNDFDGITQDDKDNLRQNIFKYYRICLNELHSRYSNLRTDKAPPTVKIGEREFDVESLGDEVINMLGNLVYLRNETDISADKIGEESLDDIVSELLDEDQGAVVERYAPLLPHNFNVVYKAARKYVTDHITEKDSVKKIIEEKLQEQLGSEGCNNIDDLSKLTNLLATGTHSQKKKAWQYLNEIEELHNTLTILDRAIKYVIKHSESEDKVRAQKACRLRQALICGFNLKGNSILQIYDNLGEIQDGANGVEALNKKVVDLKGFTDTLKADVLKSEAKIRIQPREIDDVFPRNLGLFEFELRALQES